jgi:prepilin-type processing-associated H-X9-DG protein
MFADEELADRSIVAAHLEVCADCRSWLESIRQDARGIRSAFEVGSRPALVRDTMETVRLSGPVPAAENRRGVMGSRWLLQGAATAMGAIAVAVVLAPLMAHVGVSARKEACLSNLRDLATAALVYASDNGQGLPSVTYWDREVAPYVKRASAFRCPESEALPSYGFASVLANAKLSRLAEAPGRTVVLYDQRAQVYDFAPRHAGKGGVAFIDGHVSVVPGLPGPPPLPKPGASADDGPGLSGASGRPGYLPHRGMDGRPTGTKDT